MYIYDVNHVTALCRELWTNFGIYMRPYFFDFNHNVGDKLCGFTLSPEGSCKLSAEELIVRINQLCRDDDRFSTFYINPTNRPNTQEVMMMYAKSWTDFKDYISGQIHGWLCGEVISSLGIGNNISPEEYRDKSIALKNDALKQYMKNHPWMDSKWSERVQLKHLSRD